MSTIRYTLGGAYDPGNSVGATTSAEIDFSDQAYRAVGRVDGVDEFYVSSSSGGSLLRTADGGSLLRPSTSGIGVDFSDKTGLVFLTGGDLGDSLRSGANNDTLDGGGGNDVLEAGLGNNTIDGGAGTNTVSYEHLSLPFNAGIFVDLERAFAYDLFDAGRVNDSLSRIQNVIGSAFVDELHGTSGNNVFEGGAGADTIYGNGGVDTASYAGSSAGVTVNLSTGINTGGDAEGDTLSGISRIIGSAHEDILTGDASANTLIGGSVYDSLFGEGGNDRLVVSATPMIVDGGSGKDIMIVNGPALFTDDIFKNVEKSYVRDNGSADFTPVTTAQTIVSQSTVGHMAAIIGSEAGDRIYGGRGNDILVGGGGNDKMFAGSGADVFTYFKDYLTELPQEFGRDNIYRFDVTHDRFDVSDIVDSFEQVNIRSVHKGQDTEITFATSTNPADKIILHDVLASSLTVDNFFI